MKWFVKSKNETAELSQKLEAINEQEELANEVQNAKNSPLKVSTIDLLDQDVERKTAVFQPRVYGAIKPLVDELIEHKTILVDFSQLSATDRLRTIDFITGVMYGLNGEYKKIEHHVYKFIVRK